MTPEPIQIVIDILKKRFPAFSLIVEDNDRLNFITQNGETYGSGEMEYSKDNIELYKSQFNIIFIKKEK
jgi:hypothetical protein